MSFQVGTVWSNCWLVRKYTSHTLLFQYLNTSNSFVEHDMYSQSPGEKSWNAFWRLQGVRHRDGGDQVGHFSSSQWQSKFRNYRILIQWSPILAIPLYSYVFFVWNSVCQEYRFCLYKTVSGTPSRRSQGKRPTASRSPEESFTEIEQYKYAYKIQICIQTRSSEKLFILAALVFLLQKWNNKNVLALGCKNINLNLNKYKFQTTAGSFEEN